jgi:hypothetical protein
MDRAKNNNPKIEILKGRDLKGSGLKNYLWAVG